MDLLERVKLKLDCHMHQAKARKLVFDTHSWHMLRKNKKYVLDNTGYVYLLSLAIENQAPRLFYYSAQYGMTYSQELITASCVLKIEPSFLRTMLRGLSGVGCNAGGDRSFYDLGIKYRYSS